MTYTQLNINQRINFKSWFKHTLLLSSVKDLNHEEISDTCISAVTGECHSREWRFK